eukprot:TRINITY_DN2866_c0_g1_i1.p1 TRINITY_DN2866_c0_g1~~TRINITY_DN2866_c0_g1_i1.p1  ORF type:complete len:155 (-),score=41.32 TRINITY_DN2866_c0_g1_i1:92-556(-)
MGAHNSTTSEKLKQLIESDKKTIQKKFNSLFKSYDTDKNGEIDQDECVSFIHDFLLVQELDLDVETISMAARAIFEIADLDNNGVLTKEEFLQALLRFNEIEHNISQQMMSEIGDPDEMSVNSRRIRERATTRRVAVEEDAPVPPAPLEPPRTD